MKKIGLLFCAFLLLTAFTCENEPLEGEFAAGEGPTECEAASIAVAEALLDFLVATDDNYTELCAIYRDALEAAINVCGDEDGSLQQAIDDLGDCSNENSACTQAQAATAAAEQAFNAATTETYTQLCEAYQAALASEILTCLDPNNELQDIIDELGDCTVTVDDPPTVITIEASEISFDSALSGGDITYTGTGSISASGLVYGTTVEPTLADNLVENPVYMAQYELNITGLESETQYFVRAFVTIDGLTFYGNEINFTTDQIPNYTIGDVGPGGGFIFYLDGTGHGLEIAPISTQFQSQWGCPTSSVPGTSADFGTGLANTNLILDHHDEIGYYDNPDQCTDVVLATGDVAAKNCADLVFGGYNDWYLPSLEELVMVHDNLYSQGLGDITGSVLSSSTQSTTNITRFIVFEFDQNDFWDMDKNDLTPHRAIRAF